MKKPIFFRMLSVPFSYAPVASMLGAVYFIVNALIPAAKTLAIAWFIDTAITIVSDGANQSSIVAPIVLLTVFIAYEWISPNARNLISTKLELDLKQSLRVEVIEKQARLEYHYIENAETMDLVSRVSARPESKIKDAYFNILSALQFVVSTVSILTLLMTNDWWVGLLLIALCAPVLYLSIQYGKQQYDVEREASKYDRRHKYLFDVMNSRAYTDERTLFGYTEKLIKPFSDFFGKASKIRVNIQKKRLSRTRGPTILIVIVMAGVMYALMMPVVEGSMSPGIYIALVGAINTLTQGFAFQLNWITASLAHASEYIKDYDTFLALKETQGATDQPAWGMRFETLEFRNVSFAYPGIENSILNHVSFVIEHGKHYSFVGANGAGKTTITKLICGLYDNFTGEILINGEDIRLLPQAKRKALASCVFQDFSRYQVSLFDNIAMGCVNARITEERVQQAATTVKLTQAYETLPQGLHTKLGKIYEDGTDLSGGQWQRVALARAVASPAPLRILDEPTAALDPLAESVVYAQFEEMSKGVTTIFISHRLASAKLADTIFVIDQGMVKETGSHDELMRCGGLYAEMFESQRSWYV